jgi:hypothetical protein
MNYFDEILSHLGGILLGKPFIPTQYEGDKNGTTL